MTTPTPSTGSSITLKPDGTVRTNWQTLGAIILGTSVIVGGLFSVKADLAKASDDAAKAHTLAREIKDELYRMRWELGLSPSSVTSTSPSGKPTTRNTP
jgi:hypothetical protein